MAVKYLDWVPYDPQKHFVRERMRCTACNAELIVNFYGQPTQAELSRLVRKQREFALQHAKCEKRKA